jgi:hypothetical protein
MTAVSYSGAETICWNCACAFGAIVRLTAMEGTSVTPDDKSPPWKRLQPRCEASSRLKPLPQRRCATFTVKPAPAFWRRDPLG